MTLNPARDMLAEALSFPSLFVDETAADTANAATTVAARDDAGNTDTNITAEPMATDLVAIRPEPVADEPVANEPVANEPESTGVVEPATTFGDLGVPRRLVDTLAREGITTPFPIQIATIPDALTGRDVLGRGQTGSGKTLAFGLALLVRVADIGRAAPCRPKALVLVPTRELAMQVNDVIASLARTVGLFSRTAFGGTPYDKQIRDLRRGVDVLVATPGRLGDLIRRGDCSLDDIEITVLDEADQMADMGFLPDVTELLNKTPKTGQRLLFSATLDGDVDTLVKRFMHEPVTHEVDPPSATVATMEHHLLLIPPQQKFEIVASIGARNGRTIMFARTQMAVERLAEQLVGVGVRAGALHGGKTQRARTRTLAEFREGVVDVLVATDVAARGIHVDGVSLVVHIDPPKDSKDYLHRAGRTARAGESGTVVTLVMPRQRRSTYSMLERAGVTPNRTEVRLGGATLEAVTGARAPSGVPVPPEPASHERRQTRSTREPGRDSRRPSERDRHFDRQSDRRAGRHFDRSADRHFDRSGDRHSAPYGHRRPRPHHGADTH